MSKKKAAAAAAKAGSAGSSGPTLLDQTRPMGPPTADAFATVDPDKFYRVKLRKAVKHGPTWLRPMNSVRLKGSVLLKMQDAIESFAPLQ